MLQAVGSRAHWAGVPLVGELQNVVAQRFSILVRQRLRDGHVSVRWISKTAISKPAYVIRSALKIEPTGSAYVSATRENNFPTREGSDVGFSQ